MSDNQELRDFTRQLFTNQEPLTPLEQAFNSNQEPEQATTDQPDHIDHVAPTLSAQGKSPDWKLNVSQVRALSRRNSFDPMTVFVNDLFNS